MTENASFFLDAVTGGDPRTLQDKVRHVLRGETTLRQEMNISGEELEALYGAAYGMYQSGRHRDALQAFSLLASMDPHDFRFVFGTASCFQMIDEFMLAALLHQLAASLDPGNPAPMLHTAECLTALKDREGARGALEETVRRAEGNVLYEPVRLRAEVMLANMHA